MSRPTDRTSYPRHDGPSRARSAPPPRISEARVATDYVPNPHRVVLYTATNTASTPASANTAPRARDPTLDPIGGFAQRQYYAPTRPLLKMHWWIPRGELYALWIPPAALDYVDLDHAPDQCYWVAIGRDNHTAPTNRRNYALHLRQEHLYAELSDAHRFFVQNRSGTYAQAVWTFKNHLRAATRAAEEISHLRVEQYLSKVDISSQSRGRYLEINAY